MGSPLKEVTGSHTKAHAVKSGKWKPREELGELEMKGSFWTRIMDGNKGRGMEEITVNNRSLPVKQVLFGNLSLAWSCVPSCMFMDNIKHVADGTLSRLKTN